MSSKKFPVVALLSLIAIGSSGAQQHGPYLGQSPPDSVPIVFATGIISKGAFEFGLVVHPDGKRIFYNVYDRKSSTYVIYVAEEGEEGWKNPRPLLASRFSDIISAVSADGTTLFLTSNRTSDQGSGPLLSHADLWLMRSEGAGWGAPQPIGPPVNTVERELCPSVSGAGTMYYYSSGKDFASRIRYSTWEAGAFTGPATLGREINGEGDSHNPCIAPDESYLVFTSYRSGGCGDADLYISFRLPDGSWTAARSMGPGINSPFQDDFASLSPDGRYLFFASDRASKGSCDIYWVSTTIIDALRVPGQPAH